MLLLLSLIQSKLSQALVTLIILTVDLEGATAQHVVSNRKGEAVSSAIELGAGSASALTELLAQARRAGFYPRIMTRVQFRFPSIQPTK